MNNLQPKFIFNITPCPAPRMTRSDKWKKRECVTKYFAFRDEFILNCNIEGFKLTETLKIVFILPMPESWSNKKRAQMENNPHQNRPDVDNMIKSVLDAFGKDDGFVYDVHASKFWGKEGKIIIY